MRIIRGQKQRSESSAILGLAAPQGKQDLKSPGPNWGVALKPDNKWVPAACHYLSHVESQMSVYSSNAGGVGEQPVSHTLPCLSPLLIYMGQHKDFMGNYAKRIRKDMQP